jgi:acetyl-CoA C-acetyltransferase
MCGSGMQAAIMAHDLLLAGSAEVVVAGGMESMSNAPYLLDKARSGYRMGHGKIIDHMFLDGLEDAYDKGRLMGTFAEDCARPTPSAAKPRTLRHRLADPRPARDQGRPLRRRDRAGEVTEGKEKRVIRTTSSRPRPPGQDPAAQAGVPRRRHRDGGQLQLDLRRRRGAGADAPLRGRQARPQAAGGDPRSCGFRRHPGLFPTAPIGAIDKLMKRTGWNLAEVDLFEINEAFAVVTLAAMKHLDLPHDKVNIHGGACALGHPIGASARASW